MVVELLPLQMLLAHRVTRRMTGLTPVIPRHLVSLGFAPFHALADLCDLQLKPVSPAFKTFIAHSYTPLNQ